MAKLSGPERSGKERKQSSLKIRAKFDSGRLLIESSRRAPKLQSPRSAPT